MRNTHVITLVSILLLAAALWAQAGTPRPAAELIRIGSSGAALDGYSPVSYFTKGLAEQGGPEFAVDHDGVTYWLTDAGQVKQFTQNPQAYLPAHGGWCSLMLTGSGNMTPANPESFKIVDDRLLLFWSGDFKGQPVSGLGNWESKFSGPKGEAKLLRKADRTWQALLAGKKREQVSFFNPGDLDRVNPARRAAGKKQY